MFFEGWESRSIKTDKWEKIGDPEPVLHNIGNGLSIRSMDTNDVGCIIISC